MKVYTVNLIHTENHFPEVRKRTLRVDKGENIIDLVKSLYVNPIQIVSIVDEFTDKVAYLDTEFLNLSNKELLHNGTMGN